MTQIINDKLKKICENCREKCDKPCAWISLGNEYCDDIMEAQQELERLNNIIDELEKKLNIPLQTEQAWDEYCYGYNDCLEDMLNELKEELKITQEKWSKDKQWSECRTKEWLDYKQRIDKAIEVINTQMKGLSKDEAGNLRIIKFNLIKGSCTPLDLTTEEDYKY